MRFVNVLLSAVFIAIAATAVSWSRSPSAGIGIAFAATPMLFFLTGGVNSSGPEIAAAIALWAGLGVLLQSAEPPRNLVWMSGLAAVSLVAIRRTGVVWVLLIVAIVLVAFGSRERLSALIRRPVVWAWAGATGVAFGCQLAWLSAVGSLSRGGDNATSPSVASTAAMTFADAYDTIVVQMVGNFGWLDTPVPAVVVVMWLLGLGTLAAAAVARRQIRALTAAAATLLATLLTFVAFEVIEAGSRPGFWQGRYSLPLAVGIPIVLGLSNSHSSRSDDVLRVNRPLAAVFVGAQAIAYFVYLERYSVGRGGGFSLFWDSDWSPPIPALALMVGYTVSVGVFGAMAVDSFRWRVTPKDGLTRSSRHREISKDQ